MDPRADSNRPHRRSQSHDAHRSSSGRPGSVHSNRTDRSQRSVSHNTRTVSGAQHYTAPTPERTRPQNQPRKNPRNSASNGRPQRSHPRLPSDSPQRHLPEGHRPTAHSAASRAPRNSSTTRGRAQQAPRQPRGDAARARSAAAGAPQRNARPAQAHTGNHPNAAAANRSGSGARTRTPASGALAVISSGAARFFGWVLKRMRASRAFTIVVIAVIALVILGIVDFAQNNDKIYAHVSVGEVDVSGMTQDQAAAALQSTYDDRINGASIVIYADQDTMDQANSGQDTENSEESEELSVDQAAAQRTMWKTDASTLQARMEYASLAHVAYEVGREDGSLPARLHAFFFGANLTPAISENDKALSKLAKSITRTLGQARKNYGISVTDGTATVTEGHDGNEVDTTWLADQLQQRFTDADNSAAGDSFVAQIDYAPVQVNQDQAQATADQVNAAIANGATFTFKDKSWTASASRLGSWVKARVEQQGDGYALSPYLSESKAKAAVLKHIQPQFNSSDAQVTFQKDDSGNITVHTSETGDMPMVSQGITDLQQALFGEGADTSQAPTIDVASTPIPDSMTVDEALNYGVISVVSTYTTEYTADADARNHNIHLAADLLNNSIITANGGQWSFNDTAGECNADKGFEGAGVIIGGETVDEIGGGICQVATTVFNCVYEGGYEVVTRHNHSLYIASYPDGRDAAVSWPDLDLVWANDSSNDLLMRTSHTSTTVTVELLGVSDGRTVSTQVGSWKKGEKAGKTTQTDSTLPKGYTYVKQYGSDGRSITVVRTVKSAKGKVLHNDTFASVYDARDEIDVKGTAE